MLPVSTRSPLAVLLCFAFLFAGSSETAVAQSWSLEQALGASEAAERAPAMAIGDDGNAYVAYEDESTSPTSIQILRSLDGGETWEEYRRIDFGEHDHRFPDIAIGSAGGGVPRLFVTSYSESEEDVYLYYTNIGSGGWISRTFNSEGADALSDGEDIRPRLAVSPGPSESEVHIAWRERDSRNDEIWYARSTNAGSSFSEEEQKVSAVLAGPDLAYVDGGDNVVLAYRSDETTIEVKVGENSGTEWPETGTVVSDEDSRTRRRPRVAAGNGSEAVVLYEEDRSFEGWDLYASATDDLESWLPDRFAPDDAGEISTGQEQLLPSVALQSTSDGTRYHFAYYGGSGGEGALFYESSDSPYGSEQEVQISSDNGASPEDFPTVAVGPRGNGAAVWADKTAGGDYDVYFNAEARLGGPAFSLEPNEHDFGEVTVGQAETQEFTLENKGASPMEGEVQLTESSADVFSITEGKGSYQLNSGETRAITVEFSPSDQTSYSGALSITHNADNEESPFEVSLQGDGADRLVIIYVDADASGPGDGTSWSSAYSHLQDAFDKAQANAATDYEIWVAEGTYYPDQDAVDNNGDGTEEHAEGDRSESFRQSRDGVAVYGGFSGNETTRSGRDVMANRTVLSGDIGTEGEMSDNSYHVVYLDGSDPTITQRTVLDGLTVEEGFADGGSESDNRDGGGIYCDGRGAGPGSPVACSPTLRRVVFRRNTAEGNGGALYNGGLSRGQASPVIINSVFRANEASDGGAIYNHGGETMASSANFEGDANPRILNSSFSNNRGGAVYNQTGGEFDADPGDAEPIIVNSILWSNPGGEVKNSGAGDADPSVRYSIVEGGYEGTGNLSGDPQFADSTLRVQGPGSTDGPSLAIDAGTNGVLDTDGDETGEIDKDLYGQDRRQDVPEVEDAGSGSAPLVDIGAFESSGAALSFPTPTNLMATPGDGKVKLEWNPEGDSSPDGYNVYRSDESFSEVSGATKVNEGGLVEETSFVDEGLTNGETYYYRVTAVLDGTESSPSEEVSATPSATPPPTPHLLEATAQIAERTLGEGQGVGYDHLAHEYNDDDVKHLAFLNVSVPLAEVLSGAFYVDLDDYIGVTEEGADQWVTIWADVGLAAEIGVFPVNLGVMDYSMRSTPADPKRSFSFTGPNASAGGFEINTVERNEDGKFEIGNASFSSAELDASAALGEASWNVHRFELRKETLNSLISSALSVTTGGSVTIGPAIFNSLFGLPAPGLIPRWAPSIGESSYRRFTPLDDGTIRKISGTLNFGRGGVDTDGDDVPDNEYPFIEPPYNYLAGWPFFVKWTALGPEEADPADYKIEPLESPEGWAVGAVDDDPWAPIIDSELNFSNVESGTETIAKWIVQRRTSSDDPVQMRFVLYEDQTLNDRPLDTLQVEMSGHEGKVFAVNGRSPIDVEVTTPSGRTVTKDNYDRRTESYIRMDLDDSGDQDSQLLIADPEEGSYGIDAIPADTAQPDDTYTLEVVTQDGTVDTLVEDQSINNDPEEGIKYNYLRAPTNLSISAGDGEINLSWEPGGNTEVLGYNVYRSESSFDGVSGVSPVNGEEPVTDTSYTHTEVRKGETYFYRVTAVSPEEAESGLSEEVHATIEQLLVANSFYPASGTPGTWVRIYGNGFVPISSDNTVTFGEVEATVDSVKGTVLYTQVPSDVKGPVQIRVQAGEKSITAPNSFVAVSGGGSSFSKMEEGVTDLRSGSSDWGDFDGDEDLDLVITGEDASETPQTRVYRNEGNGTLSRIEVGLTGVTGGSSSWGDFDGDGGLDLVITGEDASGTPTTRLYRNEGNGTFSQVGAGLTGVTGGSSSWGDFNGDGALDLAIVGQDEAERATAKIYRNEGSGQFTTIEAGLSGVDSYGSVEWGDYNQDGLIDLVVSGSAVGIGAMAKIYRNEGDGNFEDIEAGLEGQPFGTSIWGDHDGDGDLDLLITGRDPARLYRNEGDGNFANVDAGLGGLMAESADWGDFDGDGHLDLVLTGTSASTTTTEIFRNKGNGTFEASKIDLYGRGGSGASWGDIDGNGSLDLILLGTNADFEVSTSIFNNERGSTERVSYVNAQENGGSASVTQSTWKGSPENMIDGDHSTQWQVEGNPDEIVATFELDEVARVTKDTLDIDTGGNRSVSEYEVYARNDASQSWTLVKTVDASINDDTGGIEGHSFSPPIEGRQFKLVITEHTAPRLCRSSCDVPIVEYQLFGQMPAEGPAARYTATVDSAGRWDFGKTGTDIRFFSPDGSGRVTVEKFGSPPSSTSGISQSNVSSYRFEIGAASGLSFDSTEVRFDVSTVAGVGNAENVVVYRRPKVGSGTFTKLPTTYDAAKNELVARAKSFSEFVLASNTEPLPVELTSFDAKIDGDNVRLTWATASETNNSGFQVQRKKETSSEKANWRTIGRVEGQGTTSEPTSYQFVDEDLPYGADVLVYRLKQRDVDGTTSYSKEVTIERSVKEIQLLDLYPNPARQQATLRYAVPERQKVEIQIHDVLGRQVGTVVNGEQSGRQEVQLDVSGLATGVYFLRLKAEDVTKTRRLTVVR